MSRFEVTGSVRVWDLGSLGELHEVERAAGTCRLWTTKTQQCRGHVRFVWAQRGRSDVGYCDVHGLDTFPEARNKPDSGRPRIGDACDA